MESGVVWGVLAVLGIWAGKGYGEKVNGIYIKGKCGLLFVNDNVSGIYFWLGDLGFWMWKTLLKTRKEVGICFGI